MVNQILVVCMNMYFAALNNLLEVFTHLICYFVHSQLVGQRVRRWSDVEEKITNCHTNMSRQL